MPPVMRPPDDARRSLRSCGDQPPWLQAQGGGDHLPRTAEYRKLPDPTKGLPQRCPGHRQRIGLSLSGEQPFGPSPVEEGGTVAREERLVVAEKINNPRSFGLFNDVRTYTPAHQLQCPGERHSAFLSVTPRGAVIDTGRQAVQLRIGKCRRLPNVPVTASETSVILGEKLQESHR